MVKRLLSILTCGYMLMFYSEHMFWAHTRPTDTLWGYVATWLLYSTAALAFLLVVEQYRVKTIWAVFLAGAAFGWLTEGVIVQTTYEQLPLSISFTGLSWHAMISVWIGWYAVRQALQSGWGATVRIGIIIGLFYGLWAIAWWLEPNELMTPPAEFAGYALITSLLLIVSYVVYDRTTSRLGEQRRIQLVVTGLFLVYFVLVTVPSAPIAVVVLPILLLVLYIALRRNKRIDSEESHLLEARYKIPIQRYFGLLALPLSAILFYSAAYSQGWQWHSNWIVYLVTMPLGFVLLAVSVIKVWRRKPASPHRDMI